MLVRPFSYFARVTRGWFRTVFINAPRLMEDVETLYLDDARTAWHPELVQLSQVASADPDRGDFQLMDQGLGKVVHRVYEVQFHCDQKSDELIEKLKSVPGRYCDPRLAKFEKTRGESTEMQVGDRFHISITGPWDGPVQVIATEPQSFTFVTLQGHLEAGFIRFTIQPLDDLMRMSIESWATSAGPVVWLTYSGLGITQKMQTKMWRHYLLKVVEVSGGNVIGPVRITTGYSAMPKEMLRTKHECLA
jgi:Domain of unknown function (DUF1990)